MIGNDKIRSQCRNLLRGWDASSWTAPGASSGDGSVTISKLNVGFLCARRAEPSLVISMSYLSDQDHKVPIEPKGALYDFLSLSQEPEAQIVLDGRQDQQKD